MNNEELRAAYLKLLTTIDPAYLDVPDRRRGGKSLSGLFLPSVNDNYHSAKNKVMIIGSETAGWEPLASNEDFESIEAYVSRAMHKHRVFFEKMLTKKNRDRGHTFHNFTRDVARVAGNEGLVYSNLFCFDWRRSSPIRSPHFEFIKRLSQQLLNTQIAVLKPDYIIFANGISSAQYRREFFPVGEGGRCSEPKRHEDIAPAHYLWEFTLDEKIRCFRVHHPSARREAARIGRTGALTLLAQALQLSASDDRPSGGIEEAAGGSERTLASV